ncbi:MAG: hypothetical protein M1821_004699 [Bathelium mastoideum]|nr:MAG: hypothetical protein M1821_004699 [Bathelium mastoideum]
MIQNPPRAPTPLQPRPKAPATASSSGFAATAARTSQPTRATSQISVKDHVDQPRETKGEDATVNFIRRALCAHQVYNDNLAGVDKTSTPSKPIEELLPPLTSSNEIDVQLYAFVAIIIKEFVHSWYGKITPDHAFVDEVIQIIAHCTRALEQRLRKVDLEALLLDEVPELVEAHIKAYRLAYRPLHPPPLALDPCKLYHQLHPHPALSPPPIPSEPSTIAEQRENEEQWRQLLAQGVLAIVLPTDDLENSCLRSLVAEVLSEMILGNGVGGKLCEGWFIWEAITKIIELIKFRATSVSNVEIELKPADAAGRLDRFGLLSSHEESKPDKPSGYDAETRRQLPSMWSSLWLYFWTGVYYAVIGFNMLRILVKALIASSSLPARSSNTASSATPSPSVAPQQMPSMNDDSHAGFPETPTSSKTTGSTLMNPGKRVVKKRPVVSMRIWSCIGRLLELDVRMPWLAGLLSLVHDGIVSGLGRVGDTDGALDRILSHHIHAHLLNPSHLPPLLLALRTALFPYNTTAPPSPSPPSAAAIQAVRQRCATALVDALPPAILVRYFAATTTPTSSTDTALSETRESGKGDTVRREEIRGGDSAEEDQRRVRWIADVEANMLDVFGIAYLNKHLFYAIVELAVVRIFPEMAEKSVEELIQERLS